MSDIRNKDCELCSLHNFCNTVCAVPANTEHKDIMLIVDQPQAAVEQAGEYVEGPVHDIFYNVLNNAVGYTKGVYTTSLVKCFTGNNIVIEEEHYKACSTYLLQEIEQVKPKVIIAAGAKSVQALTGYKSIAGARDQVRSFQSTPVIATYSPHYVDRNRTDSVLMKFAQDLEKACNIADDVKVDTEPFTTTVIADTIEKVRKLAEYCKATGRVSFDVETAAAPGYEKKEQAALYYWSNKVTVLGIAFQHSTCWVVPIDHFDSPFTQQQKEEAISILNESVFSNRQVQKIAHNAKFDMHALANYGVEFRGLIHDTMVMSHLLDENRKHGLKHLAPSIFGEVDNWNAEVKKYAWEEVPLDVLAPYCAVDCDVTLRLADVFEAKLMDEYKLYRVYRNNSVPGLQVLFNAERNGLKVDIDVLDKNIAQTEEDIENIKRDIFSIPEVANYEKKQADYQQAKAIQQAEQKLRADKERYEETQHSSTLSAITRGEKKIAALKSGEKTVYKPLNLGSPAQLSDLLYSHDGLGFDVPDIKQGGRTVRKKTTAQDVIKHFNDSTGFINNLLKLRRHEKINSTYLTAVKKKHLAPDGYVHTEFLQHGTVTGRLSSAKPNLQNAPRAMDEVAARVKQIYTAPEDWLLAQYDYSQMELRIAAIYANEPEMIRIYATGGDIHIKTAMFVLGLTQEQWDALTPKEQKSNRTMAKAVNFGLIYGMGVEGLVEYARNKYKVEFTLEQATTIRNNYFKLYKNLRPWYARQHALARNFGYVTTLFGRRRRLPDINHEENGFRAKAERDAVNSPVQGTGGEYSVVAAAALWPYIADYADEIRPVNTVHDSWLFYIKEDVFNKWDPLVKRVMQNPCTEEYFEFKPSVPILVDCEVGKSWATLKEI